MTCLQCIDLQQAIFHITLIPDMFIWLVVDLPLWKIWKSVGLIVPNILNNIKSCSKPPSSYIYIYILTQKPGWYGPILVHCYIMLYIYKYIQCEAPKIAKLVNMTPITMVYGTQITIVTGAYKPTNITGGPHIVWLSLQPLATNKSPLTPRWQICGHSRGIFSQRTAGGQRDWDELHPPVAALDDVVLVPSSLRKSLPNPCWLLDEATKHSDTWRWLYMATKLVRHWTMSQHGPSSGTFYTSW